MITPASIVRSRMRRLALMVMRRRNNSSTSAGEGGASEAYNTASSRAARRERWKATHGSGAATTTATAGEATASKGQTIQQPAAATTEGSSSSSDGGSTAFKILGGSLVLGGVFAMYQGKMAADKASDDVWESTDSYLRNSIIGAPYAWIYDSIFSPFINPSREKLLPDWHAIPNIPPDSICPPTLVIDLEDTLVHATWDPKYGWRYAKRPGVDKFLQDLSKYYEIVLFSPSNFGVVDPITWTLDKNGLIMHRLYKDATRFYRGKHVKDLSKLNRDLKKVVIVDDDLDAFQFQPQNGIRIKPFVDPKDKSDRSLDKLRKFLLAIVMEGVQDIPAVLSQFRGLDADQIGDAYESMLREAKVREMKKHQRGLGGLLRSQKAFKTAANPFGEPPASSSAPRLSAKDIVGGVSNFDEKHAEKEASAASSGPPKKGKFWQAYQAHLREAEEEQRRKLEVWQNAQNRRAEEERRRHIESQAAAAAGVGR